MSTPEGEAGAKPPRPLITPDAYDGENTWDEWIGHFNSVSRVKDWNNQAKLLWLKVRLVGKARKAWNQLTTEEKSTYNAAVGALCRRFEPESKRDLYAAEFQTCGKKLNESWGDLADNLQSLADKAFPDLDEAVKEKLSIDRFLRLLGKPDVALAVHRHRPRTLNDAVTATLEIEAFLSLGDQTHRQTTSTVTSLDEGPNIQSVQLNKNEVMFEMLQMLVSRLDRMEATISRIDDRKSSNTPRPRGQQQARPGAAERGPIVCHKCGQTGHFARECVASYRQPTQLGN